MGKVFWWVAKGTQGLFGHGLLGMGMVFLGKVFSWVTKGTRGLFGHGLLGMRGVLARAEIFGMPTYRQHISQALVGGYKSTSTQWHGRENTAWHMEGKNIAASQGKA